MFKQKKYFGLIAAIFAVLLVIGFSSCGKSGSQTSDMKQNSSKSKEVSKEIVSSDIGSLYTCSMHPEIIQNYPGKCPKCKMDLVKKDDQSAKIEGKLYSCPMHPEVLANYEGTCPICKMKLEEKHSN